MYPDAPYELCGGAQYCGKTGKPHSYEFFKAWKHWEGLLIVCWPFGMVAGICLKFLLKKTFKS
jgi:hypothetical protein